MILRLLIDKLSVMHAMFRKVCHLTYGRKSTICILPFLAMNVLEEQGLGIEQMEPVVF